VLRLVAVSRAWRNIIRGAYPDRRVRSRSILGAVFAGVGVSAIIPARSGDAVRIFLAKRNVEGSTYTTLVSTVVLLSAFDFVVAGSLVLWAAVSGQLPGAGVLRHLPSFDFGWVLDHPAAAATISWLILVVLIVLLLWFAEQIGDFRRRIAQGFAVLADWPTYVRLVALWQVADWLCRLAAVLLFLRAFGLPSTLHNALLIQVAAGFASLLPISPSGIGTEQAFLLYLLRGQVSGRALIAFSVGMRITLMIVNVLLGFGSLLLMLRTVRWRRHARLEASS
jgi:uncharacterized membrane protein YbhN (UPF0104 family)